jgi:glycerol-3-phosphate dehydrogenase
LPGGDFVGTFAEWSAAMTKRYDVLDPQLVTRLCSAYGTRIDALLDGVRSTADLGRDFGAGLSEREVAHLVADEWATTAEDILWRRTKLGLKFSPEQVADLSAHLAKPFT